MTGPVEFIALLGRSYNFRLVPDLTIVDAACEPAGVNPYGPVRSGYLKVTGLMAPVQSSTDSREQTVRAPRAFDRDVRDGGGQAELERDGEPLWVLLVAHGERCSPGFSKLEGHHCIVLRKSPRPGPPQSVFERVGCTWSLKEEHWADDLLKRAAVQTVSLF